MDRAATGETIIFLLLDLRWPDCKPDEFPIPNSHGLVGNVDWGGSLAVAAYKFPSLNRFISDPKVWSTETVDAQLSFSSKF